MFPLRVRSHFSLLHGTGSPKALCARAKQFKYPGFALTDHNNLYGLPDFLKFCKEAQLQPIIGAEITLPDQKANFTCLVQSESGFSNLCRLLSMHHTQDELRPENLPPALAEGLFFLCPTIQLAQLFFSRGFQVVADLGPTPTETGQILRRWANTNKILSICSPNSSLLTEKDQDLHHLLTAISNNTSLSAQKSTPARPFYPPDFYHDQFRIWPEVIANTWNIAKRCTYTGPPKHRLVMPPWKDNDEDPVLALRKQAYDGANNRYGQKLSNAVKKRLEYELKIIGKMKFSSYFLVVRDIVQRKGSERKKVKRRICGRGSGAASIVAYCLEITNICPIKGNLYFERFLNPGRKDPPDIDIDFAWDERDEILNDVLTLHKGHTAMVCNHVYFKPKMAIRETAKVFGLPGYEISQLTKRFSWFYRQRDGSLQAAIEDASSFKDQNLDPPWPEILDLAQQLIGLPRYLSVHPGGVIITPEPIDTYVPVELASKGVPIIQWEKDGAEDMGLVKIDILSNRSLGVIRDCITNRAENGQPFDNFNWQPEDDPATQKSIAQGKTMGCFYIESPAMRLLQQKANSGVFEQLVLQSSIIRPAANEFIREYVRRLQGGKWEPLHEELENVLNETYGLMVYQEDVSKVAVALAGFTHARADGLRKILSKKDRELRLVDYKTEFFQGCRNKQIEKPVIEKIWQMMMSFDGYSFCKPHSASYAKVSFQAAYLKVHYPAEFMAAVISNQGGFYSTFAYVSEAKRLGITILHPDVNQSECKWKGENRKVRVGFLSIRGLSAQTCDTLLAKRKTLPFTSVADFLHRVRPAEDEATAMIHAGALDSLQKQGGRAELLWDLACFRKLFEEQQSISLFGPRLPDAPALPKQPERIRYQFEYKALGFLCDLHPITLFRERTKGMIKGKELASHVGRQITFAGWLLTGKIVSTRTGEAMEFLTFEDETATVETTFFPKVYHRYSHMLTSERGYILTGLVEEDFGAITLTVKSLFRLK